jgi:hypothetical protein
VVVVVVVVVVAMNVVVMVVVVVVAVVAVIVVVVVAVNVDHCECARPCSITRHVPRHLHELLVAVPLHWWSVPLRALHHARESTFCSAEQDNGKRDHPAI